MELKMHLQTYTQRFDYIEFVGGIYEVNIVGWVHWKKLVLFNEFSAMTRIIILRIIIGVFFFSCLVHVDSVGYEESLCV